MKKFLIAIPTILILATQIQSQANAKQIVLNIPDSDIKIVEHDVPNAEQWIRDAWTGKVNNCRKRLAKAEINRSLEAKEALPPTQEGILTKAMNRKDYKSRKQRDADLK